jgi:amino acid adenylation domain-containing protein
MFVLEDGSREKLQLRGLSVKPVPLANDTSKFDLTLFLREEEGTFCGHLEYATDLFAPATIERLAEHFKALLREALAHPERPLSQIDVVPSPLNQQVLNAPSATQLFCPAGTCIHDLVEHWAERSPEETAVVFGDLQITYSELTERSNRLARALLEHGARPDARVAICCERGSEMVVALLAILKAGAAYVPLDPGYPAERLRYIVEDSSPVALLCQAPFAAQFEGISARVINLDEPQANMGATLSGANLKRESIGLTADHLAYVIYTSGTTGQPKGVAMSHGALLHLLSWQSRQNDGARAPRTLQFAALGFDVAFQEIFSTLCAGGTLVLLSERQRLHPEELFRAIQRHRVERVFVPYVGLQILTEEWASLSGKHSEAELDCDLRELITAGEQLRIDRKINAFFQRYSGCRLVNQYGPTETHVVTSFTLPEARDAWQALPPIGRPVANARIYVLDEKRMPLPAGIPGEIFIGGPGVARGYWNRKELTRERFERDPFFASADARMYRTGDLGRWLPDGNLAYLGRNDDQLKIRGFRVEPGEIESRLAEHPCVHDAAVCSREDSAGEKRLVAYYTTNTGDAIPAAELRAQLQSTLPEYMIPAAYVRLERIPLTPNGKLWTGGLCPRRVTRLMQSGNTRLRKEKPKFNSRDCGPTSCAWNRSAATTIFSIWEAIPSGQSG